MGGGESTPSKVVGQTANSTVNGAQSQTKVVYRAIKESEFIEFFENVQNVQSLASKRFQDVQKVCEKYNLDYSKRSENGLAKVFAEISQGNLRDSADNHFFRAGNLLINELGFSNKDAVNFLFNLRIGLLYESGTW